jgi:hypothetical protein
VANSEVFELDPSAERGEEKTGFRWDWLLVVTAAWILFDIFTEPVLAVAIASFKFGWNDFVNGLWLWRRDTERKRGGTHFVFYCAAGFWRITVTTFVIVISGLLIAKVFGGIIGRQPQNNNNAMITTGVTMTIVCLCFVLSSLTSWLGMLLAWRRGHRVWLHPNVFIDRRHKVWPPRPFGTNQASRVITSSLIFLAVAIIVVTVVVLASLADQRVVGPDLALWISLGLLAGMVTSAILILFVRERALKRLVAAYPYEAWPEPAFKDEFEWLID